MKLWGEFLKSFIQVTIFEHPSIMDRSSKGIKDIQELQTTFTNCLKLYGWISLIGIYVQSRAPTPHGNNALPRKPFAMLFYCCSKWVAGEYDVFRHCIEFWNITVESRSFTYAKSVCNTSENFCISFKPKCVSLWKCPWCFAKLKSHNIILHAFISHSSQIFNVTFHLLFIH